MTLENSYIEILDATTILTNTVGTESWSQLSDTVKTAAVIQATSMLDFNFSWNGLLSSNDQILRWPRQGATDLDGRDLPSNTVPNQIKHATALLAFHLSKTNGVNTVSNNVKSVKVGPIAINLDSEESVDTQTIPKYIISMLNALGSYQGQSSSDSAYNVKVMR